jgi:hypothetical protein
LTWLIALVKLRLTSFDPRRRAFPPRPRIKAGHFPLGMYRDRRPP